jgi:methylenetetrahydrofolate--tRNA-(uracil-5-)-methyltransferase
MVGFQTNLTYKEQDRVFRHIPGLEKAEFVRYGQMHRNTYIASPKLLHPSLQFRSRSDLFFAGQITGVEGYAGNIASGLLAGLNAVRFLENRSLLSFPQTTMLGALTQYITHSDPDDFQPMKANFGILPPLTCEKKIGKRERAQLFSDRSLIDLEEYLNIFNEE